MSKNDEFCIKNEELCIKNEELLIKMVNFAAAGYFGKKELSLMDQRQGIRVDLSLPDVPTREPVSHGEAMEMVLHGSTWIDLHGSGGPRAAREVSRVRNNDDFSLTNDGFLYRNDAFVCVYTGGTRRC